MLLVLLVVLLRALLVTSRKVTSVDPKVVVVVLHHPIPLVLLATTVEVPVVLAVNHALDCVIRLSLVSRKLWAALLVQFPVVLVA
jgi:hypothetical protein